MNLDDSGKRRLSVVGGDDEVEFYADEVRRRGGAVLIFGCGNGGMAWAVARLPTQVVAIDPSPRMISVATERGRDEWPDVTDNLQFITADLRAVRLKQRFQCVVAPKNSLGLMSTLEELDSALAAIRFHLVPDGTLLLDVINPPKVELSDRHEYAAPPYLDPRRPVFSPHLRERRRGMGDQSESIRRLRVGQFFARELDSALLRAQLQPIQRYGNFQRKPFDDTDPLQVVVASVASD